MRAPCTHSSAVRCRAARASGKRGACVVVPPSGGLEPQGRRAEAVCVHVCVGSTVPGDVVTSREKLLSPVRCDCPRLKAFALVHRRPSREQSGLEPQQTAGICACQTFHGPWGISGRGWKVRIPGTYPLLSHTRPNCGDAWSHVHVAMLSGRETGLALAFVLRSRRSFPRSRRLNHI